jgi:Uma2 family endonuclease
MAMPIVGGLGREGWSEADLNWLPDDGNRYEQIDGSLRVSPPPTDEHNEIGADLRGVLRAAAPPGWRVIYELGVRLPGANVIPDLVVLRPGAARNVTWREPGDVALIVEIESTSSRQDDRRKKPDVYARAGIPAYWRIERHPAGPQLYAYDLVNGAYMNIAWVRPGVAWQATSPYRVTLEPATWGS